MDSFRETVARVLLETSPGDILTYGDVARLAGHPGAARAVGRVLSSSSGLPWWRVVTANGRLVPGLEGEQASRLEREAPGGQGVGSCLRSVAFCAPYVCSSLLSW